MTKTNTELVKLIQQAIKEKWGYVWGLNGELYTKEIAEKYKANKRSAPDNKPETYWTVRCAKWYGKYCADCSGLIVWAMRKLGVFTSSQDMGSAAFRSKFTTKGKISTIPNIPGIGLWRQGHIAIYAGDGVVMEAKATAVGVVSGVSKVTDFTEWGYFAGIDYSGSETTNSGGNKVFFATCTGSSVNIRKGAATSYASIGKLGNGNKILALPAVNGWCEIAAEVSGKIVVGYMSSQYVKQS